MAITNGSQEANIAHALRAMNGVRPIRSRFWRIQVLVARMSWNGIATTPASNASGRWTCQRKSIFANASEPDIRGGPLKANREPAKSALFRSGIVTTNHAIPAEAAIPSSQRFRSCFQVRGDPLPRMRRSGSMRQICGGIAAVRKCRSDFEALSYLTFPHACARRSRVAAGTWPTATETRLRVLVSLHSTRIALSRHHRVRERKRFRGS